jgi:hypothetical protein
MAKWQRPARAARRQLTSRPFARRIMKGERSSRAQTPEPCIDSARGSASLGTLDSVPAHAGVRTTCCCRSFLEADVRELRRGPGDHSPDRSACHGVWRGCATARSTSRPSAASGLQQRLTARGGIAGALARSYTAACFSNAKLQVQVPRRLWRPLRGIGIEICSVTQESRM